ncbi:MAG: hypothetical protein ACYCT7_10545 [bacterium]
MNKKYRVFLFFPLAAVAIFYLIGATEISYMFNAPMIMTPMQVGMPMQMGQTIGKPIKEMEKAGLLFPSKINPRHSNKLNLQYYVTCVECQNLPTAYYPVTFYYGSFIRTISFTGKICSKHFSSDIPHPPQNRLI